MIGNPLKKRFAKGAKESAFVSIGCSKYVQLMDAPVASVEYINPFPMVISSPLFANAANIVLLLTARAVTPPVGVTSVSEAETSDLELMVSIDNVSLNTAKPDPVPNQSKVSPCGTISLIILLLSPL